MCLFLFIFYLLIVCDHFLLTSSSEVVISSGYKTTSVNKHDVLQYDCDHNSPVFPPNYEELVKVKFRENMSLPEEKKIPRNFWVSFRETPLWEKLPHYIKEMVHTNDKFNWKIMFLDNPAQEEFLERYFPGTSVLWAYRIINDGARNSASDIWRIAMLYTFGGFYMDDDSYIRTPLEKMVKPDDELIVAREGQGYKDDCFISTYNLSNYHLHKTYNTTKFMEFADGRNVVNWALFIKPRHPLMVEVLNNVIDIVRREYLHDSVVHMRRYDQQWKYCMCVTGPIVFTATLRKYHLLHVNDPSWKIKIQKKDWNDFGGVFKMNIEGHYRSKDKDNYFTYMQKHNIRLLSSYANITVHLLHEKATAVHGEKEIYYVQNGSRHLIPDFDTFQAMGLRLHSVIKVDKAFMTSIPDKGVLPKLAFAEDKR